MYVKIDNIIDDNIDNLDNIDNNICNLDHIANWDNIDNLYVRIDNIDNKIDNILTIKIAKFIIKGIWRSKLIILIT